MRKRRGAITKKRERLDGRCVCVRVYVERGKGRAGIVAFNCTDSHKALWWDYSLAQRGPPLLLSDAMRSHKHST